MWQGQQDNCLFLRQEILVEQSKQIATQKNGGKKATVVVVKPPLKYV